MTTPSTVSAMRPGLANIPASASFRRSRKVIPERETFATTATDGSPFNLLSFAPLVRAERSLLSLPSTIRTRRDARLATFSSCVTMARVRPSRFNSAKKSRIAAVFVESRFPVGSSHSNKLGEPTSARAMATRCLSPPDSFVGRKSARWVSPTRSIAASARSRRPPKEVCRYTSASMTFSSTVRYGSR